MSGTPACRRQLMASAFAMTVAPVLKASRSAPGRLPYYQHASSKQPVGGGGSSLIKMSMRDYNVVTNLDIVKLQVPLCQRRLLKPGIV